MIVSISPYILECDPEQTDFHPFRFIVGELEVSRNSCSNTALIATSELKNSSLCRDLLRFGR